MAYIGKPSWLEFLMHLVNEGNAQGYADVNDTCKKSKQTPSICLGDFTHFQENIPDKEIC